MRGDEKSLARVYILAPLKDIFSFQSFFCPCASVFVKPSACFASPLATRWFTMNLSSGRC